MRCWLFLLLLAAPALALETLHTGLISGRADSLRSFGSPVAFDTDADGRQEALLWDAEGDIYLLDGFNATFWYGASASLAGVAAAGGKIAIAERDTLHLIDGWKNEYPGWPQEGQFTGPPLVLQVDGGLEIFAPTKDNIAVYDESGLMQTLPVPLARLAAGDVNGDGEMEIAASAEGKVYLFDSSLRQLWLKTVGGRLSRPAISGGRVAVTTADGDFRIWDASGKETFTYASGQLSTYESIPTPLFVGDLVVFAGPGNEVHAFKDGKEVWAVRLQNATALRSDPLAVDVDGGPEQELLVPAGFQLQVLRLNGSLLAGFQMDGLVKTPALADLDGNGRLEVVVASESEHGIAENPLLILQSGQASPSKDRGQQGTGTVLPDGSSESGKPGLPFGNVSQQGYLINWTPPWPFVTAEHTEVLEIKQLFEQYKGFTYEMDEFNKMQFSTSIWQILSAAEEVDKLNGTAYDEALIRLTRGAMEAEKALEQYAYDHQYQVDRIEVPEEEGNKKEANGLNTAPYLLQYLWADCEGAAKQAQVLDFGLFKVQNPFRSEGPCHTVDLALSIVPPTNNLADCRDCIKYCPKAIIGGLKAIVTGLLDIAGNPLKTAKDSWDRTTGGLGSFVTAVMNRHSDDQLLQQIYVENPGLGYDEVRANFEEIKANESQAVWSHVTVPVGEFLAGPGGNGLVCSLSALGVVTAPFFVADVGVAGAKMVAKNAVQNAVENAAKEAVEKAAKEAVEKGGRELIEEGVGKETKELVEGAARMDLERASKTALLRHGPAFDDFSKKLVDNSDELIKKTRRATKTEADTLQRVFGSEWSEGGARISNEVLDRVLKLRQRGFEIKLGYYVDTSGPTDVINAIEVTTRDRALVEQLHKRGINTISITAYQESSVVRSAPKFIPMPSAEVSLREGVIHINPDAAIPSSMSRADFFKNMFRHEAAHVKILDVYPWDRIGKQVTENVLRLARHPTADSAELLGVIGRDMNVFDDVLVDARHLSKENVALSLEVDIAALTDSLAILKTNPGIASLHDYNELVRQSSKTKALAKTRGMLKEANDIDKIVNDMNAVVVFGDGSRFLDRYDALSDVYIKKLNLIKGKSYKLSETEWQQSIQEVVLAADTILKEV